jgi:hypothetical protein
MYDNIIAFTWGLDILANKSGNPYAYKAGYLESTLSHLVKDVPGAAEWLDRRVELMREKQETEQ